MIELYDPDEEGEFLKPQRGRRSRRWLSLLIGLALGLGLGLGYAWGLDPVQFYNTDPADLRPEHKETWILLVAAAYHQDGDLDRALSRLAGLNDPQIGQTVADLTVRNIQAGKPATRNRALAAMADALGARTDQMLIYLATPQPTAFYTPTPMPPTPTATPPPLPTDTLTPTDTPEPTDTPTATPTTSPTPTATPTIRPTLTQRPTATSIPPYYLERRQRICQTDSETPRIEIFVQTEEGAGIPGSEVWVTWEGGVDRFITGLKPEIGLGYADFDMTPNMFYAVAIGVPTLQVVGGLRAEPCLPGEGDSPLASWRLTIVATSDVFAPTPTVSPTAPPTLTATPTVSPAATATSTSTPTQTPRAP